MDAWLTAHQEFSPVDSTALYVRETTQLDLGSSWGYIYPRSIQIFTY
ncbi:hypothetical protein [Leptothoe sp. PORK10 BA2]|nr:hypothetical protein [Leptothoe sp. PORK10 BA2]MEA5466903.1 hypothetical protein [Leptothoe sp. PORK10 BA2]